MAMVIIRRPSLAERRLEPKATDNATAAAAAATAAATAAAAAAALKDLPARAIAGPGDSAI